MTLAKGFLKSKGLIKREKIISGLILWVMISYPLYAFFYMFREAFRILSDSLGGRVLLVLTNEETFIFNLFYSSIAVALGYMFSLKFVLENSTSIKPTRRRLLIRQTLNQQGFFTWSFLLWFGKVASMLAIWYVIFPLQFDIDFLEETTLFLLLLPLVLFSSTWPHMRLVLGSNSLKWFGSGFLIFVLLSVSFAFKNFIDIEAINKNLLKNSIEYSYQLEVPISKSHQRISRRSIVTDIYLVVDTIPSEQPVMFLRDIHTKIQLNDLGIILNRERDKISEFERLLMPVNLHIDKSIRMDEINKLKQELRKSDIRRIQYSTGVENSKYPSNYPAFKYSGIQEYLHPRYYTKFETFLDSAENIDYSDYSIQLPESLMYRINGLEKYNRIEIFLSETQTTLNGQLVTKDKLEQVVYKFIKKYSPNFIIIFNTADQVAYGGYIEYLDLIYTQIDRLRNEMSIELYDQHFDYWYWGAERDSIRSKYPINIVQWTKEEKRLIELVK